MTFRYFQTHGHRLTFARACVSRTVLELLGRCVFSLGEKKKKKKRHQITGENMTRCSSRFRLFWKKTPRIAFRWQWLVLPQLVTTRASKNGPLTEFFVGAQMAVSVQTHS